MWVREATGTGPRVYPGEKRRRAQMQAGTYGRTRRMVIEDVTLVVPTPPTRPARRHIDETLAVPGVNSADWRTVEPEPGTPAGARRTRGVHDQSRDALLTYVDGHAARLCGDGVARSKGWLDATRRVRRPG